jgi:hypothetical protein
MQFGDGAQDTAPPGTADAAAAGTAGGDGDEKQARSLGTQESLQAIQAIQDIIDKLAAVTQQLRSWRRSPGGVAGSDALAGQAPQQPVAVGGAEGRGAQ